VCGVLLAPNAFSDEQIIDALGRMAYRGDGELGHSRIGRHGGWAIGHLRLAIQDIAEGNQPFFGTNSMTAFVGEIFNHGGNGEQKMIRTALRDERLFHSLDGFWSIVHVTGQKARAYTDHLGIKPLYFWEEHNIVCSEIEPMFALAPKPMLDPVYLSNCIKFGYDYSGRTPYQGIVQVAPGTRLEIDFFGSVRFHTYWNWHLVPQPPSLREAVELAILRRLIGERPVAMLLSGGLDSSIIYYTLRWMDRQVEAFSVENGESEYLPDDVTILDLPDVSTRDALKVMKAPLDLGSLVPQVSLARAVRDRGYHVCLTGDGADEVFGGYRRAKEYDSQHSDVFSELPFYHLPRLDRVMMASTIELRSPFLSPSVVAFGLALPHHFRTE
jgi:asparagine synthase (glutamine-hydrolysing)